MIRSASVRRLVGDVAEYAVIRQQPTALEASSGPRLAEFERALRLRGLAVQRVADMSGSLAHHAVFVTSVCAALYRHGTDPHRLARDRPTLALMCTAISDGFAVLRKRGVRGAPRNLSLLQSRLLRALAIQYWARRMRWPTGEIAFAA